MGLHLNMTRDELTRALQTVKGALPTKASLPVLEHFHLNANGEVWLAATNLAVTIATELMAPVVLPGNVCIQGKQLLEFAGTLPAVGAVELTLLEKTLKLACGNTQARLKTLPGDEFPHLPDPHSAATSLSVPTAAFAAAVQQVLTAGGKTDTENSIWRHLLVQPNGETLTLVAADGVRLARAVVTGVTGSLGTLDGDLLLPAPAAHELGRVFGKEAPPQLSLWLVHNRLVAVGQGAYRTLIAAGLGAGQYPDYTTVIPQAYQTRLLVERQALLTAVKQVGIFAREREQRVQLSYNRDHNPHALTLTADALSGGAVVDVTAEIRGAAQGAVWMNARFLQEGLLSLDCAQVAWDVQQPYQPLVLRPWHADAVDAAYLYLFMPVGVAS